MISTPPAWCSSFKASRIIAEWKVNYAQISSPCFIFNKKWPTLTRPCHSPTPAFPLLMAPNILGTFLIPFRWLCIAAAITRLSERRKEVMASCRAVISGMEREGRNNQARSRERPSAVFVWFKIPMQKQMINSTQRSGKRISKICSRTKKRQAFFGFVGKNRGMTFVFKNLKGTTLIAQL